MTAATETPVLVGDVFVSSWGYDQTNVDFYEVVHVTPSGKTIDVIQIGKIVDHAHRGSDHVRPNKTVRSHDQPAVVAHRRWLIENTGNDDWNDQNLLWCNDCQTSHEDHCPPRRHRVTYTGSGSGRRATFRVASYANAYRWDGSPQHQTAQGWGH